MSEDMDWGSNLSRATSHIRGNCNEIEDAWSLVGDLGELPLSNTAGQVISTKTLSKTIGEMLEALEEEVEPEETVLLKNTNAWGKYSTFFPRGDQTPAQNVRAAIGDLTYRAPSDDPRIIE